MYHFIGIKGAGMSSLAAIMKQLGYEVQGSDVDKHYFTEVELIKNNIPIFIISMPLTILQVATRCIRS